MPADDVFVDNAQPKQDAVPTRPLPAATPFPSRDSLDAIFLSPFVSRASSPSPDVMSDSDLSHGTNRYSSSDSFDLSVLATPGSPDPHFTGILSMPTVPEASFLSNLDAVSAPAELTKPKDGAVSTAPPWPVSSTASTAQYPVSPTRPRASPLPSISAPATPSRKSQKLCNPPLPVDLDRPSLSPSPSIRVTRSVRGAPRLSFVKGRKETQQEAEHTTLGPPLPSLVSAESPDPRSAATTPTLDSKPPLPPKSTASSTESSPTESTPVARKRRLNALRSLVSQLDFAQPWSVVDRVEPQPADDECFWAYPAPPQLNPAQPDSGAESLVPPNIAHSDSTCSLPLSPYDAPAYDTPAPSLLRSRRFSRSMASLIGPPSEPVAVEVPQPRRGASTVEARRDARLELPYRPFRRTGSILHRSGSVRPPQAAAPREVPRPRLRKESFGVKYSGYSKSLQPLDRSRLVPATSWRASLASHAQYERVASGPDGDMEIRRQEIIWEMCETEAAFVHSCKDVIRLFVAPLRDAQGQWMQGLPGKVCQLFESLEDICFTHSSITVSQDNARQLTSGVVDVAEFTRQLRVWVPRLVCHEKYIMLFNTVVSQIDEAARDETNIFGEFLRLQTRDNSLGSMSLSSMLLKPVQRLTKYTLFLRRLLAVTPDPHPVHASLVELINATETIIGGLEACKAREDDFNQLLALESCLDGLPEGYRLAVRGRRLVAHAQVVRVADETPSLSTSRLGSLRTLRATLATTVSSTRLPQPSVPSSYASSRATSTTEVDLPLPQRPGVSSTAPSLRSVSGSGTTKSITKSLSRSTSSSSLGETARQQIKLTSLRKGRRDDPLTLLVFNDLVLVATPVSERPNLFKRKGLARLAVVAASDGGLGTVDDVQELSGWGGHGRAFALATRSPDGGSAVVSYAIAPGPKARSHLLPGPGLDAVDQVVGALAMARQE